MQLSDIAYTPLTEKVSAEKRVQLETCAALLFAEAMPAGFIGDCSIEELYLRHILDSILPAIAPESEADLPLNQSSGLSVFDLGAGAGLPSLPLAILYPQHEFHLLDSQEKRCRFAASAAEKVGLKNVHVYHGVVQDFAQKYGKDKRADVVVFRAFRKILAYLELAIHVLRNPQDSALPNA
ncbi:MAG: RsmG family class I SAM-dependent methyltransferase [Turneriella sp.]